jgi:hypothetical protein
MHLLWGTIERGKPNPRLLVMVRIAGALDVAPPKLLDAEPIARSVHNHRMARCDMSREQDNA